MAFVKKRVVRGTNYYSLVEKIKRDDGTYGIKTIKSFGREIPTDYLAMVTKISHQEIEGENNRLPEYQEEEIMVTKLVTKQILPIEIESGDGIWEKTIGRLKTLYFGD